ncbi:cullin-associated NEDD8-dissociated protein 1, C-terminal part-like, partial [Teratosphaeria destructans]
TNAATTLITKDSAFLGSATHFYGPVRRHLLLAASTSAMDTSYLSQQVTTIIERLHGFFDEIGVPKHERDSRESELFTALSDTLHNQLNLVAKEKHELTEEAQKLIKTIRQMERSLDDSRPSMSSDYESELDGLKVTFPLTDCIQALKEKHHTVSRLHRERYEQVKKLVEALDSYASHLEPSFIQIKLPPTSPTAKLSPTFDLSPTYVAKLDQEFTRVYEEYNRRVTTVAQTADEIINLWSELGTPQAMVDSQIVQFAHDAPEQLGLHQEDLKRLNAKKDKLIAEKQQRERKLKELRANVEALWDRLGIADAERKQFLAANRGCGLRQINEYEDELSKLNELKRQNLHLFVEDARFKLQELWDSLFYSEEEMLEFTPAFSHEYTDALLSAHEHEIARLEALKAQREPILAAVEKHRSLIKEREELEQSSQDASRLLAKGAKGERRDPGKLLREEKMRKRIAKELPKVETSLRQTLEAYEEEYGRPFCVHGNRYLDELEAAQAKAPPPRSKTPNALSRPAAEATKSGGRSARPQAMDGSVRGAPPPRSKTPTGPPKMAPRHTLGNLAMSTSHSALGQSTLGHSMFGQSVSGYGTVHGKPSPSKIPGATRLPMSTMRDGQNSPERSVHSSRSQPHIGHQSSKSEDLRHTVRGNGMAPPPRMKDLFVPPTPTPAQKENVQELEDPYVDKRYGSMAPPPRPGYGRAVQSHDSFSSSCANSSYAASTASSSRPMSRQDYPMAPASRQMSNTSSIMSGAASGSENWETYTDASDNEEVDATEAYYARVKASQLRMQQQREQYSKMHEMKRPATATAQLGASKKFRDQTIVEEGGNAVVDGSEAGWTDDGDLHDPDPDIRYMTLKDLTTIFRRGHTTFMVHDYGTCARTVEGLLHTLNDTHGDVQNESIVVLGEFVKKAPENILCPTIEKVSTVALGNSVDTTVAALAVRAIVVSLAAPSAGNASSQKIRESYNAISKALIPRLIGRVVIPVGKGLPPPPKGMLQEDLETGNDSNSLDLLVEVARCFGSMLQEVEIAALEQSTMEIVESERCGAVMKKKAVSALSALAPYFSDALLASYVSNTIEKLRQPHLTSQQRKLYLTVYGSLARSIPQKFGPYLKTLAPFVLAPLSQEELDTQQEAEAEADGERDVAMEDVREAALVAIEGFLQACAADMKAYTREVIECSTRFLKYEPNVADDDDEDMAEEEQEEDEFEGDEDFEEETGFEDEDDVSWKVRRCSAKTLHALIATLDPDDPALYGQLAPALIMRFKEREESVRNEVVNTLAFLITKTGNSSAIHKSAASQHALPPSRKRRRGFSESLGSDLQHAQQATLNGYASPGTPPPTDRASQNLAEVNPDIVNGSAKLLKSSTVSTKQAVISLIKDLVAAQKGGLADHADQLIDPAIESLTAAGGGASNVAGNALRIEVLQLLKVIADNHSTSVLEPHIAKIIPALVGAAKDRYAKVSVEAFTSIESFVKALTPPRSAVSKSQNGRYLTQLLQVVSERITATDTDTEVRQKAVQILGLLIGRTSGSVSLLSESDRFAAQQLVIDRLKNELTRLDAVRAVDTIAVLAQGKKDFKPGFISAVTVELGQQLRKANRSLRGASLSALRMIAVNQASRESVDEATVSQLVEVLVPLLKPEDLHMMSPALIVLAAFAKEKPDLVATQPVVDGICSIIRAPITGAALDALITCVEAIGRAGAGAILMKALLNVGTDGDTDVSGQVIGTLLVCGGPNVGVQLDDFVRELQTQQVEKRKCLALSVLGEACLRLGTDSPLKPETFTPYFTDESDKVQLAAAVALGRAGAGNVKAYLPKIMAAFAQDKQYLLLHSVKELLQHSNAEDEVKPYTQQLWQNIIASGQTEDNKVVSAECIGRLAIIDPAAYLPQLLTFLQNPNATIRGMVIAALRYVFADTDDSYNGSLEKSIVPMLAIMLGDSDLDNQRVSLSTFNSALHNKPGLVLPHLADLLPYTMAATVVRPELIREVQMGPFKHKVDDGLDMRKAAYETLYALLDSPAARQRIDLPTFFDRIIAGLTDEHEIKILCCLVLSKLLNIAPTECVRRLEGIAAAFRATLSFKPKENAVKQELEKVNEQNRAVVKCSVVVGRVLGAEAEGNRAWRDYWEWIKKEFTGLFKGAEEEVREGRAV